jgi:low temperature requirement protein LtrA
MFMTNNGSPTTEFRAQTIELFFDLVFVFTITQITHLVEHAHGAVDLLYAFSVLMLVWWMYGGYIWLTNHAHTPKAMRLVLIAALAGFLVMALAIPDSHGAGRLVFGLAYLFIILLHFAAFVMQGGAPAAKAMLRIVPFNLAAAGVVIGAGMIEANWSWILLLAPALLYVVVAVMNTGEGFSLNASHFVERHGLLLIIVLGETIIAVGNGLGDRTLDLRLVIDLGLSVGLIAALWWSYFDADDLTAEHIMVHAHNRKRTRIALFGYAFCHLFMIAGLIMVAAGLKAATGPADAHGPEYFLVIGAAVYLGADVLFRQITGIRPLIVRIVAALLLVVFAAFGSPLHGTALIASVFAVLAVIPLVEAMLPKPRLKPAAG